ncbi:MAG TPA: hypothetical protein VG370_12175 [Chloroflexota bacterium]|jgi:hypothetical protein|nr:hypothetical protein [Chloroflexota bacterium]
MAKRADGQGSEWYDPRHGLCFAAYTRCLRPDGTPEIKRFASKLSDDEARRKRDEDRELRVGGTPAAVEAASA